MYGCKTHQQQQQQLYGSYCFSDFIICVYHNKIIYKYDIKRKTESGKRRQSNARVISPITVRTDQFVLDFNLRNHFFSKIGHDLHSKGRSQQPHFDTNHRNQFQSRS